MPNTSSVLQPPQMLTPFPESGRIHVPPALAGELLAAAERLPAYENRDFYEPAVQDAVLGGVRGACRDGFDWLVGEIKRRVARRPYCALVRGLRFDEGHRLFVALNRAFGPLVALPYRAPRAQLVHYVQPSTDIASARGGRESERLHTDTTDWEQPVAFVSMLCVRPDPSGGGRSRVLDADAVRAEVGRRLGREAVELLSREPVPWQLSEARGGGVAWRKVLDGAGMCWRRQTIELALGAGAGELSQRMLATLDAFERTIETCAGTLDFLLREGELLLMDNLRTVHARTPVGGAGVSDRLMLRSWIQDPSNGAADAIRTTL